MKKKKKSNRKIYFSTQMFYFDVRVPKLRDLRSTTLLISNNFIKLRAIVELSKSVP